MLIETMLYLERTNNRLERTSPRLLVNPNTSFLVVMMLIAWLPEIGEPHVRSFVNWGLSIPGLFPWSPTTASYHVPHEADTFAEPLLFGKLADGYTGVSVAPRVRVLRAYTQAAQDRREDLSMASGDIGLRGIVACAYRGQSVYPVRGCFDDTPTLLSS